MMKSLFLAAMLLSPAAAFAWPASDVPDPYGAHAIARNDYTVLERRLADALARGDRTPEVLLNLAQIYRKERRDDAARALYQLVLGEPNVDLTTLNGSAWSHDLARKGLARDQMASR